MNESVRQADVLTEKQLRGIANSYEATVIDKLVTSHRTLNSRNAKLVHENDELMAENVKLKELLKEKNGVIAQLKLKDGGT